MAQDLDELERLCRADPKNQSALMALVNAYRRLGRRNDAYLALLDGGAVAREDPLAVELGVELAKTESQAFAGDTYEDLEIQIASASGSMLWLQELNERAPVLALGASPFTVMSGIAAEVPWTKLHAFSCLRSLQVSGEVDRARFAIIARLPRLRSLQLLEIDIEPEGIRELNSHGHLRQAPVSKP